MKKLVRFRLGSGLTRGDWSERILRRAFSDAEPQVSTTKLCINPLQSPTVHLFFSFPTLLEMLILDTRRRFEPLYTIITIDPLLQADLQFYTILSPTQRSFTKPQSDGFRKIMAN